MEPKKERPRVYQEWFLKGLPETPPAVPLPSNVIFISKFAPTVETCGLKLHWMSRL
jgi:hypothetical protein